MRMWSVLVLVGGAPRGLPDPASLYTVPAGEQAAARYLGDHLAQRWTQVSDRLEPRSILRGERLFLHEWSVDDPKAGEDGLGPHYNATSCAACHPDGGASGIDRNVLLQRSGGLMKLRSRFAVVRDFLTDEVTLANTVPRRLPPDTVQRNAPALWGSALVDLVTDGDLLVAADTQSRAGRVSGVPGRTASAMTPPPPRTDGAPHAGELAFHHAGCTDCHVPDLGQVRGIYSDLLLHDMGEGLSDPENTIAGYYGIAPQSAANAPDPAEWRTPPLWGVGSTGPWLHDGRAATLEAAILLHGGEAQAARQRFVLLGEQRQHALIRWLQSRRPELPAHSRK